MSTCLICLDNHEATFISLSKYYNCNCKAECHVVCLDKWSTKSGQCLQCRKFLKTNKLLYSEYDLIEIDETTNMSQYHYYPDGNLFPTYFAIPTRFGEFIDIIISCTIFVFMSYMQEKLPENIYNILHKIFLTVCIRNHDFE